MLDLSPVFDNLLFGGFQVMQTITSLNAHQLPISFSVFLVSQPLWKSEGFTQGLIDSWFTSLTTSKPSEKVKHSADCKRRFGALDLNCPRCVQLFHGSARRPSWSSLSKSQERVSNDAIRRHDCVKSHCGPVCTFGDW
jgi:hypothetical protein